MATQIILIRHGETALSLTGQHTGRTDLPLTENGERRASRIRELLHGIRFDLVISSPLVRARRTCEIAGFGAVARLEPDLQEWDYGDFEGRTTADICTKRPAWNVFEDGCPGGESVEQVCKRADRVLAGLSWTSGRAALFSHGQFLRVLAMRWTGIPVKEGERLSLDTASMSILGFAQHNNGTPAITLWNAGSDTVRGLSQDPQPQNAV